MAEEKAVKPFIVEELITEFEQRYDIDEQRDEELYSQYAWEKDVDKSWEQLVDKDGVLQFVHQKDAKTALSSLEGAGLRENAEGGIQKRGVVRNLVIIFDTSDGMREVDFKPDRLHCAATAVKGLIQGVFHQGPMTQLALVALRDKRSIMVSKFGTPPSEQIELLDITVKGGAEGVPSLQNGLEMAIGILSGMPAYTTREIIVIFGSTKTFDPGNILTTLQKLKDEHIAVNAVSIAPEMYILKHICVETGGSYAVSRDAIHMQKLMNGHTMPPKWRTWMEPVLTKVGFPPLEKANTASLCICHSKLTYKAYVCPQCHSKSCAIPTKCKVRKRNSCAFKHFLLLIELNALRMVL
ncbi:Suppressor of stem-loop protein 1 [Babesia sp. Xinjiang]|uniref:Suppressor of stem-loop protein 1 n=1 Tax=Babesia sp. Xinjiang TaxID=462227 RepID=UPI000A260B30|nr:Suppressor of stem-loop protein 1 [Babesia sp. Xinjiang]ORM41264.1 Suppressor of stem-loop protein 1 [Babesia sp. Xinjiang]